MHVIKNRKFTHLVIWDDDDEAANTWQHIYSIVYKTLQHKQNTNKEDKCSTCTSNQKRKKNRVCDNDMNEW